MLKGPSAASWQFDGFTLMPDKRLLLSHGVPVPLTAKAFDTLVVLVANRDRVVSKDELLTAVWPDAIVEEGNLTQQIFLIRKALQENAQRPRYVVTVAGRGYRFTAPVSEIPSGADGSAGEVSRPTAHPVASSWNPNRVIVGLLMGSALAVLGTGFGINWMMSRRDGGWLDPASVRIQRLTETGRVTYATITTDGRYVAYVESEGDQYSLNVRQIATGGRTQIIAPQSRMIAHPRFSPDGEFLYFTRGALKAGGFLLSRVPAIGGPETPVLDNVDTEISFSPDGRQFAFMRGAGSQTHILVAEAGGGKQRVLATRKGPLAFSFVAPAWSPDGKWVAASGTDDENGRASIILLPVDGGPDRELYSTTDRLGALRWVPDGSGLVTVLSETLSRQLAPWQGGFMRYSGGSVWRIAYPGGEAERLTSDLSDYHPCCIDVASNGRMILVVLNTLVSDLWTAPADSLGSVRQITWGTPVVGRHSWMPDNDTVVYRDLAGRIAAVRRDGGQINFALPEGHKAAGAVSACGDGRYIVFPAAPGNNVWRITPGSGGAVKLTGGQFDLNPVCSSDGQWVLYLSTRRGVPSLWRVPIEGGEPAPVVRVETLDALPSPTGAFLYYATYEWKEVPVPLRVSRWIVVSSEDGKRRFAFDPPDRTVGTLPEWAPDESGLDYIVTRNGISNIWRQPLAGGSPVQVTNFNAWKIFSFAWSRDGKWVSLAAGVNRTDAVLISRTQ